MEKIIVFVVSIFIGLIISLPVHFWVNRERLYQISYQAQREDGRIITSSALVTRRGKLDKKGYDDFLEFAREEQQAPRVVVLDIFEIQH